MEIGIVSDEISGPLHEECLVNDSTNCDKDFPLTRKKGRINNARLKDAFMCCEWNMCSIVMNKMRLFLIHIADHIVASDGMPSNEGYVCLWRNCGFTSQSKLERDRHIYFHGFHAKIKGIGDVIMKCQDIQCSIDSNSRNVLPELPDPFECMWDNCGFNFVSAQEFYWHVGAHANSVYLEKGIKVGEKKCFECSWAGCKMKTKSSCRLIDHVRSHTQEKTVGCPTCGTIFAGYSKFIDHCFRNVPEELLKFVCSHCKYKFATERLLREHVRSHVNHFKCPYCEMTCPSKSAMETHILYRHSNNKPFSCPHCDKRYKTQQDVIKHLPVHSAEASFLCPFPDCDFSSRSYSYYYIHLKKLHTKGPKDPYMCHICQKTFNKGAQLTNHLKRVHDFHWPAGHSRFRYSKDDDGYYKLQTTRFESIELAQEILQGENDVEEGPLSIEYDFESVTSDQPVSQQEPPIDGTSNVDTLQGN